MAAEQDVIREFLVALGFKVDKKGLKTFTDGVEKATKGVVTMVATIEGAALTIGTGVAAMASRIESLGFVANRVGSSGNSLRALSGAAQDFGVSAQSAVGSVEALASAMRNNPAMEGWMKTLGVQTRDANGHVRDTVDLMTDLGSKLNSKYDFYVANQIGKQFGIDENLLLAMKDPAFMARLREIRQQSQGNGFSQAQAGAHEFMMSLRELGRTGENVGIQVEAALQKKIGPQLKQFTDWAEQNAPMIADRIADVGQKVIDLAEEIKPGLIWVVDELKQLDSTTGGLSTKILIGVGAFKLLGGFQLVKGVWQMVAAVRALGFASSTAGAGMGLLGRAGIAGVAAWGGLEAAKALGLPDTNQDKGISDLKRDDWWHASFDLPAKQFLGSMWQRFTGHSNEEITARLEAQKAAGGNLSKAAETSAMAVNLFTKLGWSKDQAAGIVANLQQESNLNGAAVGDNGAAFGIAQWHRDRQAAFARWAGHDIHQSTLMEQLRFVDYELRHGAERRAGALLSAASNANQAGEIVSRYYERPAASAIEAARRGQMAAQLSAHTQIYVSGTVDPAETARQVAAAQGGVNDGLVRTMQGAHGWA